jgi:signal peptidase I
MCWLTVSLLSLALAVWLVFLRPPFLGGNSSYVIVNGPSMQPTLEHGDIAVLYKKETYTPGEVVAFQAEGGIAIHRVHSRDEQGYMTKGDNKDATDPWLLQDENIIGSLVLKVPAAGKLFFGGWGHVVFGSTVGLLLTVAIFWRSGPPDGEAARSVPEAYGSGAYLAQLEGTLDVEAEAAAARVVNTEEAAALLETAS